MYVSTYSEEITKKLAKLKKKDTFNYNNLDKKMQWILSNPRHKYKDLHYTMKGIKRIHIGHFVLIFRIDHLKKIVSFEDYDHHDVIYK